jgi:tetratricopeptide (TPR) repeat protein
MAALVSLICLEVARATPPTDRTTFDSNTNTYAELTNSLRAVKQRLEVAEKSFGRSDTNVANLLSDLAGLYDDMGDYAQAASLDQRCLAIREELLGPQNMEVGDVLDDLAYEYQEMGEYDQALPLYQRSLVITEKLVGKEHFDVATTLDNMADVYRLKGDCAHALPLCQRALEIRKKVLGEDHPDLTDSLHTLAAIRRELGDYNEALALCEQAIAIGEKHLGPEHPMVAENIFLSGQIHCDIGNYAEAASACRRAISIDERNSGPENPDVIEELTELATVLGKQRNFEQSISNFVEVFKRQRHYFVGQIVALPDSTALHSIQVSFQSAEIFHSVCAEAPAGSSVGTCRAGAEELALNKAFLEEVRAAQAALDADPRTSTKELLIQYRTATIQLDRLKQSSLSLPQREIKRRALQDELNQLETALAERAELVATTVHERNLTLTDIARNLPPQSALLDFVQYHNFDLATTTN